MFTAVSDSMMYIVEIRLLPTSTLNIFDALDIQDPLLGIIYERVRVTDALDLCNIQMIFKTDLKYSKLNNVQNVNPRVMYADIKIELLKQNFAGAQNPSNVADEILKNRFRSVSVNTSVGVPLEFQVVFTQLDFKLYNIFNHFGQTQQFSYSFSRKNITDRLNVLLNYGLPDLDGFTFIPNIDFYYTAPCEGLTLKEISILKYSSCPKVFVSADDIKWSDTLDGIVVDDLKINRATFYYTDDKHIMMCVDQYENLARHLLPKRSLTPEIIVSIVCNGLSITALLITVTTMAILPTLRNSLPGHNNLCLSLSLLIAQILYLVGTIGIFDQYSVACKTVALLIHVSWLYVVFWMNVCTYHLYITLTRTHVHSQKIGVKKCLSYHLYVLMFSLLFVGLNILISFLQSTGIGYGGKYCYITSRERILITFVSPTILIVLANLVMFLFVTCRVTKSSGIRKSVRNDRNDLIILTKLASITGIGWIFGFLYIWTEVSILSYIFIVLNAGQGVFILSSFVLNGRVFEMFRNRFSGSSQRSSLNYSSDQQDKPPFSSLTMM
ncbi:carbohydrate binding [Mactra antiquata]